MPLEEAQKAGAMMLFGEKYGEHVRMITFDPQYSRELCGGCHVTATGQIGSFKIISESAVAAGVRRIEAITAHAVDQYVARLEVTMDHIQVRLKSPASTEKAIDQILEENHALKKQIEQLQGQQAQSWKTEIRSQITQIGGGHLLVARSPIEDAKLVKDVAYQLEQEFHPAAIVLGSVHQGKPLITVCISKALVEEKSWHAGNIVKACAPLIGGGGGGQSFFATAGGSQADGLDNALSKAREMLQG
jgi:alanyl-tRNA synthetase